MRARYIRIKLPEELVSVVASIAEERVLGYRTMAEFVIEATRTRVRELELADRLPFTRKRNIPRKLIDKQGGPQ